WSTGRRRATTSLRRCWLSETQPKKRCLELSSSNKCRSFGRLKVPDTFFWAKLRRTLLAALGRNRPTGGEIASLHREHWLRMGCSGAVHRGGRDARDAGLPGGGWVQCRPASRQ